MKTTRVAEVQEILDAYIRGTRDGDAALLGSLFHPRAVVAGYVGAEFTVRSPDSFIERAATTPAGADYRAAVTKVAVAGDTANGTIVEDGLWDGLCFVNHFHLVRDPGGAWVITAKLFHQDDTGSRHQGS